MTKTAHAYTLAWRFGYQNGQQSGREGTGMMDADPCSTGTNASYVVHFQGHLVNLTTDDSQNRCESGYSAGWNSTCAQALENLHIDHSDIGSCPGFTDKQIQCDPVAQQTPQEKAECAKFHASEKPGVTPLPGGGAIITPPGGVPCA